MQIVNQENCKSLQHDNCTLDFVLVFFRVFVLAFVLRFVFVRAFGNVLFMLAVGWMMIDQAALCIH